MSKMANIGLFLVLALNGALVWATPAVKVGNVKLGEDPISDDEFKMVVSDTFGVTTTYDMKKGKCTEHVKATGKGVRDVFDMPCTANGVITVTSDKLLMYGYPGKDALSLYTDKRASLVVFQDGKCVKRTYTTVTRTTMVDSSNMQDEECKQLKTKVTNLLDQESKYLQSADGNNV